MRVQHKIVGFGEKSGTWHNEKSGRVKRKRYIPDTDLLDF